MIEKQYALRQAAYLWLKPFDFWSEIVGTNLGHTFQKKIFSTLLY